MLESLKTHMTVLADPRRYRKAIAAGTGVGLLLFLRHQNIELPGLDHTVSDLVVGALTVGGVYGAANDGPKDA